ncbi:response regulator transcription factor [Alicyclobacillus sp. SO9]|uniref:response regulator n=1 Tax=Alicyclobacillus sp. SO9 TaxID=2665646 RepID=UPI0018E8320D|nr:response regulator transcription factor [Alicyclobacillus sp. SO9]QQE79878.1 response regulator transcription factor [Alicyclobacillus sp. SO9]
METYHVVIADDSEKSRKAVRLLLNADKQFQVVAEAATGNQAIEKTREHMPDLVLMDINMPDCNGFEATRLIKKEFPYVRVVILSVSDDATDLFDGIRNGAQGYLVKSMQPSDWIHYLHGIMDGDTPVSREIAKRLLAEFKYEGVGQFGTEGVEKLTHREQEILKWVSTGASNKEIASNLFISENTVKNHLKNIMAKLHIQNRVQLAIYAQGKHRER